MGGAYRATEEDARAGGPPEPPAGVLRSLPLRALLVAEVVSTTGSQMTWLALPWFVLTTTGSPAQMSAVAAAETAGYAVFGLPSGGVLARLGPRRTMLACDALRAPLMLLVPLLHWVDALSLAALVALSFLLGALATPYGGAQRMIVPELLGEDEGAVSRANALFQGATRVTFLLGPLLAGLLIALLGSPAVLAVDAGTFAFASLLVAGLVPARGDPGAGAEEGIDASGLLAGLRYLGRDRLLLGFAVGVAVGDAAFYVVFVGLPVLVREHLGADPRLAGILFGAWGGAAVVGNVVAYRRFGAGVGLRGVALLTPLYALPSLILAVPVAAPAIGLALAASGFANGLVNPTFHALLTLRPPPAVRAKALTAVFTASQVGAPAALLLAGPGFERFGARPVLGAAAVVEVLAALVVGSAALFEAGRAGPSG